MKQTAKVKEFTKFKEVKPQPGPDADVEPDLRIQILYSVEMHWVELPDGRRGFLANDEVINRVYAHAEGNEDGG